MADTPFGNFTNVAPQAGDIVVIERGKGSGVGANVDLAALIVRDENGLLYAFSTGRAGLRLYNGGASTEWFLGQDGVVSPHFRIQTLVAGNFTDRLIVEQVGNVYSGVDNSNNALGLPSKRWTTVYAATGAINTSDERDKVWRGALTGAEIAAGKRIIAELGFYQWKDAVGEKGDGARWHFGVRAQRAFAILEDEGLDWRRYAWCCYDEWPETPAVRAKRAVKDKQGNVLEPARAAQVRVPSGNRYGVRPDQLAMFLIAVQEARTAALEKQMGGK